MVIIRPVPVSSKPSTLMIRPREAITVPPGTPGAPTAKMPSRMQNRTMVMGAGSWPYSTLETVITKNTSVSTEPHKWMLANRGMPKSTMSRRRTEDLRAPRRATARVAAEDMVPTAVR